MTMIVSCKSCRAKVPFSTIDLYGRCQDCAARADDLASKAAVPRDEEPKSVRLERLARSIVLTTETAISIPIDKRLGIVSAERVVGINLLKDLFIEARDLVGGNSATAQGEMAKVKAALLRDIRFQAAKHGADMVVALDIRFADFGSRGGSILATAIGTAVKLTASSEQRTDSDALT